MGTSIYTKYRTSELHGNTDGLSLHPLPLTTPTMRHADIFYFHQVEDVFVTAGVKNSTGNDPVLSVVMDTKGQI